MSIERIAVCEAQVPFVTGGAEAHVGEIVRELQTRGYQVERISLPFKWYPKEEILAHAAAWRLIDLSESNGRPIDLVIATKFPSYFVRHPNKVTWLIHQYRSAYDLCGTAFGDFEHTERDVALRDRLVRLDREMLAESVRLFANARNTAGRLERFNGLRAEPLYHPPPLAPRLREGAYGDYLLFVGRLEPLKRPRLVLEALAATRPGIRLKVAGDGPLRPGLEQAARELNVQDRVEFCGRVPDDRLVELYAGALATVYPPYDEDYGYVTLESFLAAKPVITTTDAGGPLEFVTDGVNGLVCEPGPESLAAAMDSLAADRDRARALGAAGLPVARAVTWNGVVSRLLGLSDG
jgi:glycosyltransferase involved in cell wall biosynthesis